MFQLCFIHWFNLQVVPGEILFTKHFSLSAEMRLNFKVICFEEKQNVWAIVDVQNNIKVIALIFKGCVWITSYNKIRWASR